jgi:hypothetical protein
LNDFICGKTIKFEKKNVYNELNKKIPLGDTGAEFCEGLLLGRGEEFAVFYNKHKYYESKDQYLQYLSITFINIKW